MGEVLIHHFKDEAGNLAVRRSTRTGSFADCERDTLETAAMRTIFCQFKEGERIQQKLQVRHNTKVNLRAIIVAGEQCGGVCPPRMLLTWLPRRCRNRTTEPTTEPKNKRPAARKMLPAALPAISGWLLQRRKCCSAPPLFFDHPDYVPSVFNFRCAGSTSKDVKRDESVQVNWVSTKQYCSSIGYCATSAQ